MDPLSSTPQTPATLDALTARVHELEARTARLAALEAAHTRQQDRIDAIERENARGRPPAARFGRGRVRAASPPASPLPAARTSRRGVLGTVAKAAAATIAAGVLAEQVGTRAAYADNYGSFSSSTTLVPAVSATGTSGAIAVDASSDSGTAVSATSTASGAVAVYGKNTSNDSTSVAVRGRSDDGSGGLGPGIGVEGDTADGLGVYGTATGGFGVYGTAGAGTGVLGKSTSGFGVEGTSTTGTGVYGTCNASSGSGVWGEGMVFGVYGSNTSNVSGRVAVLGHSDTGNGGLGPGIGVQGETAGGYGLYGTATTGYGVVAHSASGTAISAGSGTGSAVVASSSGVGYGLYLTAPSGWAIGCVGRIRVLGNAIGTATLTGGTTSKTVTTSACDFGSLVILTPTNDPGARVWAVAGGGAFTIHASAAPSGDIVFTYLLIN